MKAIQDIAKSLHFVANNIESVALPYLKDIEGSTKQRIHNKGKDSNNQIIGTNSKRGGKYSPGYEKRKSKIVGSNIYPINLQLKGDLLRSFTVGISNGVYVLRFQDDQNTLKAAYNEERYNADIYKPSNDQLDDAKEVLIDSMKELLQEIF